MRNSDPIICPHCKQDIGNTNLVLEYLDAENIPWDGKKSEVVDSVGLLLCPKCRTILRTMDDINETTKLLRSIRDGLAHKFGLKLE
jgi:uncharacterized protein YbaR (Trm112 family)